MNFNKEKFNKYKIFIIASNLNTDLIDPKYISESEVIKKYGYWNCNDYSYNDETIKNILSISQEDIDYIAKIIFNFVTKEIPLISNLELLNVVYGPSLYWYSFLIKRILIQFNSLEKLCFQRPEPKFIFSNYEITKAKYMLFQNKKIEPTLDASLIAYSSSITNFILYNLLLNKNNKNVVLINDNNYSDKINSRKIDNHQIKN